MTAVSNFLALDVGNKRIGVALANAVARLPQPFGTINNDGQAIDQLKKIIKSESVGTLVVGLPRDMSGNETEQTKKARDFGGVIENATGLKVHWQDEAVTSRQAESELNNRGIRYNKGHIDALAATYILSDFLSEYREVKVK